MSTTSELKKALTAANQPLLQPQNDLEPVIEEELLKLQPLAQLMSVLQAEGLTHEYRLKTSHPAAWFEGELTQGTEGSGTYDRKTVQLKIQRIWGKVSGFAQTVDEKFINALAEELSGSVQGMSDLFEFGALFGCSNDIGFSGDRYQYSGILPRLFAFAPGNIIDAGGAKVTLDMLDQAVAKAHKHRQTRNDPSMWLMGLRMKQVVDGLQTRYNIPLTGVTLNDGKIEMPAYYRRPIYETDSVTPEDNSPACTGAAGGDDEGELAAETYKYRIAKVTQYGEQVAGTASADVEADATHLHADLSWTGAADAKNYMIFRKAGSGAYQLLDIIPALTYDADGKVNGKVETYTDLGNITPKAIEPLESGEEQIVLANINPNRGAAFMGKVDDMGRQLDRLVSYVELARTGDFYSYFLKSYLTLRFKFPNLMSVVRHVKTS